MNLFINTPGTYVHVKDELFQIRRRDAEGQVLKTDIAAPKVTAILLQKGAAMSTDAMLLALKHNVDVLLVRYDGQPVGRLWHARLGSTTRIRKCQLEASLDARGLEAVQDWLGTKLERQQALLRDLKKHREALRPYLDERIGRIEDMRVKILAARAAQAGEVAEALRGWEGTAGRLYFEALSEALPKGHRFAGRSSRPAQDAFNAFLNYGYGILYGKVEKALMLAGLDPYVGFMHRDDYNQKSLVYDAIEPYRPWVDRVVMRLFAGKRVRQDHTEPVPGGVTLSAEAKPMLVEAVLKHLEEDKIRYRHRNLSREHAMQLEAHRLAQGLMGKELPDRPPETIEL
ncbi:MAG: CRISPR-associated endonuclease Cas1 [Bacteroidetes bacterium]|nr:MAG: CRISPR-associated endonuclease Cas1 [Bacteroidota bacterium]